MKSSLTLMLVFIVALEFGMWLYVSPIETPVNVLFDLVYNGVNGGADFSFFDFISDNMLVLIGTAAGGIVIGSLVLGKDQGFVVYASLAYVFFSYMVSFFALAQLIAREFDSFFTIAGGGVIVATVIILPIIMLYITTILRFWRGIE